LVITLFATAQAGAQCEHFILVATTDYTTGSTSTLDLSTAAPTINVEPIHSDAVVRHYGGLAYVLNRYLADNLQILDPCNNFDTIDQFSTGNGSNPHDIVFVSPTEAYITRYELGTVLKMNPQTGATITTIDLSGFADPDGIPEMSQMFVNGSRLYVMVQRLDRPNYFAPTAYSTLAVIDITTDTVVDMSPAPGVQGIELLFTNPFSEVNYRVVGGTTKAYFSCVGFFALADAGVIECDLADPSAQSVLLTESAAGGDIVDVEIISPTKGYAVVSSASFDTELIAFDPSTGLKIGSSLYAPGGYNIADIEPSPLGLLVSDRTPTGPGIRRWDMTSDTQITTSPINVGLPPFDIVIADGTPTGIGDMPAPAVASLGQNYPNPFNPSTSIPFSLDSAGWASLRIFDVSGRLVATLVDENRDAGEHVAHWNGRTATGDPAPTGVYFARLVSNKGTETRKRILIK
jgi:hypothetical protein